MNEANQSSGSETRIQTVLGTVAPDSIGPTMMHEHIFLDMDSAAGDYDTILDDEELLAPELQLYLDAGGSAIVEVTPSNLGRNPEGLARMSARTGVQVIMGGGWYRSAFHPAEIASTSTNDLAAAIEKEFTDGVGDKKIKPGIFGEIGTGRGFITPAEERVFRAVARAQRRVGFSITTHTTHFGELALEQISLLSEEGVPTERIVIGHLGERIGVSDVIRIAETGVFVCIDHVGSPSSRGPSSGGFITDTQRATNVAELVRAGFVNQITLGMDTSQNSEMTARGGRGYGHLLRRFVPLLLEAGVTSDDVQTMLVANPRRVLAF